MPSMAADKFAVLYRDESLFFEMQRRWDACRLDRDERREWCLLYVPKDEEGDFRSFCVANNLLYHRA